MKDGTSLKLKRSIYLWLMSARIKVIRHSKKNVILIVQGYEMIAKI